MKKSYLILISLLGAFCICGVVYFVILPLTTHRNIVDNSHSYQPYQIKSYDDKYVLETYKIEDDTGVYATFSVKLNATQEEVFRCPEKYRAMDLKSISWEDNTFNIIVKSGDVGTVTFEFADDTWGA